MDVHTDSSKVTTGTIYHINHKHTPQMCPNRFHHNFDWHIRIFIFMFFVSVLHANKSTARIDKNRN